jgi:putative transposase
VATWPEDAPRGAVSAFCKNHNVSRAWFYLVRGMAADVGAVRALEKRSPVPATMSIATAPGHDRPRAGRQAVLQKAGLDYGPLSVISKLTRQGFIPPSRATVARIFSRAGVVVPEPRKKPRSAYKSFVYLQPNACWQIDSTEWPLADGTKVAISQVIDCHSRLLTGGQRGNQRRHDHCRGSGHRTPRHAAEFPLRQRGSREPDLAGRTGALVEFLKATGVQPINSKPCKPATQGKNQRFDQTLHKRRHWHRRNRTRQTVRDAAAPNGVSTARAARPSWEPIFGWAKST